VCFSGIFRATIGFSAPHFQPPRAAFFIAKFAERYFFRRYSIDTAFKTSLSEEAGLGAHGNVILVSKSSKSGDWTERQFVWAHIGVRPWGNDVSQQCRNCGRLRVWGTPSADKATETVQVTCRFCSASLMFKKPPSLVRDGVMGESGRGQWYFSRRIIAQPKP
jgi:hypothetical protein